MPKTLVVGESVTVSGVPYNAAGGPSTATLKKPVYASSDVKVFTVSPGDKPTIKATGLGTATLSLKAQALEPDNVTTDDIQGTDSITVVAVAPKPPVATSIAFEYGAPIPGGPKPMGVASTATGTPATSVFRSPVRPSVPTGASAARKPGALPLADPSKLKPSSPR